MGKSATFVRLILALAAALAAAVAAAGLIIGTAPSPPPSADRIAGPGARAAVGTKVQGAPAPPRARRAASGRWSAARTSPARFRPGELLAAETPPEFVESAAAIGFTVVETMPLRHIAMTLHRLRLPPGTSVRAGLARLRQRFPGAAIDANHYFTAAQAATAPTTTAPTSTATEAEPPARADRSLIGWEVSNGCGEGISIGMIDAGIDTGHPALREAEMDHRAFTTPGRRRDAADHGTAVAALLVGQLAAGHGWEGLLPAARLAAASIFEIDEKGEQVATARSLLAAVDWIVGKRVQVINFSVAGPDNRIVRLAVERTARSGSILVAAAGNWGSATRQAYPAAYPEVIGVTAVAGDGRIYRHANRGPYIDFAAPGVGLWTAVPGGGRFQSGTSFAAPYVSSMVGVALRQGTRSQVDAVRAALRKDALDLGIPGRDDVFGWGLARLHPACKADGRPPPERSLDL